MTARGQQELTAALDQAGNLVSQLRRREQLDGRLDQLARYQTELEDRSRRLVDRQLLPVGVLVGLGGVFVFGVVLILAGLLHAGLRSPARWAGRWRVLGLAGFVAAAGGKVMLERSNVHQLDACRKQLDLLRSQVEQTKTDRDALDAQLPRGGGPIAARLQAAEKELAALEELAPLDARRTAARQEAEAAGPPRRRGGHGGPGRAAALAAGRSRRPDCRRASLRNRCGGWRPTATASPSRNANWPPGKRSFSAGGGKWIRSWRALCSLPPTPACR